MPDSIPPINPACPADIAAILAFVMHARAQIFPMLDPDALPADLADFEQVYLNDADGHFLIAKVHGQIVAAIGYLPYDHRFAQLDYRGRKTVEIVRLFVDPAWRSAGLAGRLFQALCEQARATAVDVLYLHTHPFLPGAIRFWEKHGFVTVDVESDPVWQTTHMEKVLDEQ
ncbi:GNAT family N-acetyltransferase [Pseudomonas syringae]|nr:GNAT family N-acetyltransferase [Pseudomonas syringae]MBD8574033.1 GNAT family N-acetyltransferase [Pseudomonas syringae]MBD8791436.1 GNAT family N-acetyltransferase [Pseudomonas syringae]MBD8801430.1 GNAT family N-acetyltransferase [Pseudomonas syringae]MBD8810293.1 GNAT family N-acetyltransferase [Pseudomonas syringae]